MNFKEIKTYKISIFVMIILQFSLLASDKIDFNNSAILQKANKAKTSISLNLSIAETPAQWQKGLMKIKKMKENNGMLFIFPKENYRLFWMKDTYISLDLIYLDKNKKIVEINQNNKPMNEDTIKVKEKAKFVLEVNAGFVKKHNIKIGDILILK
jgi:hypothetical protein